jgi:hypothetical protein
MEVVAQGAACIPLECFGPGDELWTEQAGALTHGRAKAAQRMEQ